jgi:hypothetical protein
MIWNIYANNIIFNNKARYRIKNLNQEQCIVGQVILQMKKLRLIS